MALREFWNSSPRAVLNLSIQQIISSAGDGRIRDGSECSIEFREFLGKIDRTYLSRYVRSCLEDAFKDSGLVLQDLINEMGRRLGFEVEPGLYRGRPGAIGFDGLWKAPDGHVMVVEVKTTDHYTLPLEKIADYKSRLVREERVQPSASILIIVGREDTGALEAQIRGSRYAWDIRLIGADRLDNLLQIKEESDEDTTVSQIHDILRPFEYTKVDKIIDVIFSTARDVEPVEAAYSSEDEGEDDSPQEENSRGSFKQVRTDADLLNRRRLDAVNGFGRQKGKKLLRHRQTLFWTTDHSSRACVAVSKRYESAYKPYWYAYHTHWDDFLQAGTDAHFILACMDRSSAFAIPHQVVKENLEYCSQTIRGDNKKKYWHIALGIEPGDRVVWDLTKVQKKIDLRPYLFNFPIGNDVGATLTS